MIYTREVQVFLTTLLAVNKPLTPHNSAPTSEHFIVIQSAVVDRTPISLCQVLRITVTPIIKFFRKLFIFVSIKYEQNKTAAHVQH
jgi:hypothetical protein